MNSTDTMQITQPNMNRDSRRISCQKHNYKIAISNFEATNNRRKNKIRVIKEKVEILENKRQRIGYRYIFSLKSLLKFFQCKV